jgi:beta-N-acetylhexosaminidase
VVTDALDMAGLTHLFSNNIGLAAVESFKAGNDVLLIPADFPESYNAMIQAVRSGEISRERLDRSVLKILRTKASLSLQDARVVDLNAISALVGRPENLAFGQQVANDAIALIRDNGKLLPLKSKGTAKAALPYTTQEETHDQVVAVVFSDDMRTDSGRAFGRELRNRIPDARVIYLDPRVAGAMTEDVMKAVSEASQVIAGVYVVPSAGKIGNTVTMADATGNLLQQMLHQAAAKTVVVAMGNPYLASDFPQAENYLCTFSNASVSEIAAVKALFGEIPIRGHLPVSIPNIAVRGAGLERPAAVGGFQNAQK